MSVKGPKRLVAYVGRIVPLLSETFVVREIAALRELGLPIKVFGIHPFDPEIVHPEAPELKSEVIVLSRPRDPRFWLSHLFFALRFPKRYFRCLRDYVLKGESDWKKRFRCLQFFLVAPYFAHQVRKLGITHIHAHFSNVPTAVAMTASALTGVPFSFTVHTNYEMIIDGLLMNQKFAAARFVVTISRFNITNYFLPRFESADPSRIHVVRCGIDCEKYAPANRSPGNPPVVYSVGRLADNKGFHTLIDAFKILKDRSVSARCVIIGSGPERERLLSQIEREGLSDRLTLAGQLLADQVRERLKEADLFALPCCISRSEEENGNHDGIPVALMEAMAMGIPTVSTRIAGIPELICDGETGLLVPPEDPAALAEAIEAIASDRRLAAKLSLGGREMVQNEFNIRKSAARMYALFTKEAEQHTYVRNLRSSL